MWKAEVEVSSDRIPSPELSSLLRHESTSKPLRNLHPASRTEDIDAARHANEALCSPAASLNETGGHGIPNMPSPQPIEKIRQPAPDTISQRQLIAEIDAMFPGELLIDDKRIDANSRLNNSQRAALIALHRALARESPSTWHAPQHAYAICDLEQPDWQDTRPAGTWWHGMTCAPRMMWYLLKSMLVFLATAPYLLSSVTALLCEGIYALFVDSVDYLEQCR